MKTDRVERWTAISTIFHNFAVGIAAILAGFAAWHGAAAVSKALEGRAVSSSTASGDLTVDKAPRIGS
jgi:hypothetical protein